MRRLLKISLDLSLLSFIPILSWFALGLLVDKNLINVFTLTYPIQFIWYIMKSIFSTGANISKEKDNNKHATLTGMTLGIIIGFFVFGFIAINIESYISFMNMDINIYKEFALYSVIQLYIQLVFQFVLEKLYYENKNTLANKYSLAFNLINFIVLVASALIFKNKTYIIITTLLSILIFTLSITIKQYKKFKFKCNIKNFIKYDSVELFNNIAFFLIFLFGLSNILEFGAEYALALTFVALITDTQWDTFDAIAIAAQIDISKKQFNYKEHVKNAYKLLLILLLTVSIMFACLYNFYNLNYKIMLIYFSFELINFIIYPIYRIKTCYLQLEYSAVKTTINKMVASTSRMLISLLKTPFCTGIGQVFSSTYQFISISIIFNNNFVVDKSGEVSRR